MDWKVIVLIATTFLGTGGVWQYQKNKIDQLNYALSMAEKSIKMRNELDSMLRKIIDTNSEFEKLELCGNPNKYSKELNARLDLYKENFRAAENKLATIEGREPRNIDLQFVRACPPTNLRIE